VGQRIIAVLDDSLSSQDEAGGPSAAGSWLPAALAVLVCSCLLSGAVLGFWDVILATGQSDVYFLFPATCH
jgi:hypothetical protein